jgi:GNAT superfamily N-acetyltransferase
VEITEFDAGDHDAVRRYVDLANAVRKTDSPWVHPLTVHEYEGHLRHGWDGEPPAAFLATADGETVGAGELEASRYDNLHLAWLQIEVHPDDRRRGRGSDLFDFLVDRTRAMGRTSVGIDGWDSAAARGFATRHGLALRQYEVNRRQFLADLDWARLDRLYVEAAPHATAYELVRSPRCTPDDELPALAAMVAAINDAPLDELDVEDEVFTPERIRAYEHANAAREIILHRLVARHRETGELAGHTVVGVDGERPGIAEQHDTSVVRAHRGHRLGLLLKIEMLRWLREAQPQLATIDTWNAASNDHMIGVNEAVGYRAMGRVLAFQRSV